MSNNRPQSSINTIVVKHRWILGIFLFFGALVVFGGGIHQSKVSATAGICGVNIHYINAAVGVLVVNDSDGTSSWSHNATFRVTATPPAGKQNQNNAIVEYLDYPYPWPPIVLSWQGMTKDIIINNSQGTDCNPDFYGMFGYVFGYTGGTASSTVPGRTAYYDLNCGYGNVANGQVEASSYNYTFHGLTVGSIPAGYFGAYWSTQDVFFPGGTTGVDTNDQSPAIVLVYHIQKYPEGGVSTINCTKIVGWAFDRDREDGIINIDVKIDGTTRITSWPANLSTTSGIGGNHGFNVPYSQYKSWVDLATPNPHAIIITARGINPWGGGGVGEDGFNTVIYSGSISPCASTTTFSIDPTIETPVFDDSENPTSVTFDDSYNLICTSTLTITNLTITRNAYIQTWNTVSKSYNNVSAGFVGSGGSYYYFPVPLTENPIAPSYKCGSHDPDSSLSTFSGLSGLKAGDKVCMNFTARYNSNTITVSEGTISVVGTNATVTAGTNSLVFPDPGKCAYVSNKPYVSFYGNDVKTDSSIWDTSTGNCNPMTSGNPAIRAYNRFYSDTVYGNHKGYLGSGSQFAAFAGYAGNANNGPIQDFATALMRLGVENFTTPPGTKYAYPRNDELQLGLSFANSVAGVMVDPGTHNFGGHFDDTSRCIPDYWAAAPATVNSSSNAISVSNKTSGSWGVYKTLDPAQNALRIQQTTEIANNSTDINGRRFAIYADQDTAIVDNITYAGANITCPTAGCWATAADIPSFYLIVRGDIYISSAVTRLDGVYIALKSADGLTGGHIYTCANTTPLTGSMFFASTSLYESTHVASTDCNSQLVVNGAFISAKSLRLLRTYKSLRDAGISEFPPSTNAGSTLSNAAEVFNFSPEIYLVSPPLPITGGGQLGTYDYITSLPPVL